MLLSIKEIDLLNRKYCAPIDGNYENILGINIETFKVINELLEEIKVATKRTSLSPGKDFSASRIRRNKYEELYPTYLEKVRDEDKLIFSKLINYITSEAEWDDTYLGRTGTNIPLHIDYKVEYDGNCISGIYREDDCVSENSIAYHFKSWIIDEFNRKFPNNRVSNTEEFVKVELYSTYDISFDLNNVDILKEQVFSILDSSYFKSWKFKGMRDDYEKEILSYMYSAKREVNNHEEKNIEIYKGINLDTCRYAACLMQFVKHSEFSVVKTLEDKNELYNKLYPYIVEMIPQGDRDIFAKLSNYLNFENEDYSISGYNDFLNTSKKDVISRIELFKEVEKACETNGKKSKNTKKEPIQSKVNYYPFSHMFTGGSAIFETKGWGVCAQDILKDILEDETFKNWKFSGLKTKEEEAYTLEYKDRLEELNFSENSYYILGHIVNLIHNEVLLSKKLEVKERLIPIVLKYIPLKEQKIFKTLLDYFTDQDEEGINVHPSLVTIDVDMINKENNKLTGRTYVCRRNKFSQVPKDRILDELLNNTYSSLKDKVNENNLFDLVEFRYRIGFNIFPSNFGACFEKHYSKDAKYNVIKNILESLEVECDEEEVVCNTATTKKESIYDSINIEPNSDKELNLLDLLELVSDKENSQEEVEINVRECTEEELEDNLNGQLLFAI